MTFREDKINVLTVESLCPGLFAKALANVNIGSLICTTGADGFALAVSPAPFTSAAPNISSIHGTESGAEQEED